MLLAVEVKCCNKIDLNIFLLQSRLDKEIEQLEKEQRDKMKMWSDKTEPLDTWLAKKEAVVESYEPIGYDISYVKGQSEDAQVSASSKCFLFV